MDNMRIESKFTTGVISKLITLALSRKLGCTMDIRLNAFHATVVDEKTHLHLDVDAELSKEELASLLKKIGVN